MQAPLVRFLVAVIASAALVASCDSTVSGPRPQTISLENDFQVAAPGAALSVSPRIRVTADTVPIPGVPVNFAVTSGGGTLAGSASMTGPDGTASAGVWTLGAAGINELTATVAGLPPVTITAMALRTSPNIQVTITPPAGPVGSFELRASVTSVLQLATVEAHYGGLVARMAQRITPPWFAGLQLDSVAEGRLPVIVTATDMAGGVTDAMIVIDHEYRPRLNVSPSAYALANPTMELTAACVLPNGGACDSMTIRNRAGTLLVHAPTLFTGVLDLGAQASVAESLRIVGWRAHQSNTMVLPVAVLPGASGMVIAKVPGNVRDYLSGRVLYLDTVMGRWGLYTMATNTDTTINGAPTTEWRGAPGGPHGWLTPAAAVMSASTAVRWTAGATTALPAYVYAVAGNFAVTPGLYLVDLTTGSSSPIPQGNRVSLTPNGEVAFSFRDMNGYERVGRYRAGAVDTLGGVRGWVDGTQVIIQAVSNPLDGREWILWYANDLSDERLLSDDAHPAEPVVLMESGWAAWLHRNEQNVFQPWTRSPGGTVALAMASSQNARLESLASDGRLVVLLNGRRYLLTPPYTAAPRDLGATFGRVVWRAPDFIVLWGPWVLRLN